MISHDFNGLLYLDRNQTYQEVKKSCDILNPVIWNEQGEKIPYINLRCCQVSFCFHI